MKKEEYERYFARLIDKFECGINQLKHRGFTPYVSDSHNTWNLRIVGKVWRIASDTPHTPTHPLSIFLEGRPIDISLYGRRVSYNGYESTYYPYMQLEKIFFFRPDTLRAAFFEGIQNRNNYTNYYYNSDYKNQPEMGIAFDVGRYCLHKFFGSKLPYKDQPFFK